MFSNGFQEFGRMRRGIKEGQLGCVLAFGDESGGVGLIHEGLHLGQGYVLGDVGTDWGLGVGGVFNLGVDLGGGISFFGRWVGIFGKGVDEGEVYPLLDVFGVVGGRRGVGIRVVVEGWGRVFEISGDAGALD